MANDTYYTNLGGKVTIKVEPFDASKEGFVLEGNYHSLELARDCNFEEVDSWAVTSKSFLNDESYKAIVNFASDINGIHYTISQLKEPRVFPDKIVVVLAGRNEKWEYEARDGETISHVVDENGDLSIYARYLEDGRSKLLNVLKIARGRWIGVKYERPQ